MTLTEKSKAQKQAASAENQAAAEVTAVPLDPMTNPTAGFDTNKLRLASKREVFLNEVGSAMISTWHQFISNSRSILVSTNSVLCLSVMQYGLTFCTFIINQFVVDASNSLQLSDSLIEFLSVVSGDLLPEEGAAGAAQQDGRGESKE